MKYGKLNKMDTANGPGCRVSLFVSGCRNGCPGCFNEESQSFDYGDTFTRITFTEIINSLKPYYIDGLSVLGGDPMEPENRLHVENLCMAVKDIYPDKTIWMYTGYMWEEVKSLSIMKYIDVLVDGPYVERLRDLTLAFRGSSNQRLINVQESLKKGGVVLYELYTGR